MARPGGQRHRLGGIQYFVANFLGPRWPASSAGIGTLLVLAVFLRFWRPDEVWRYSDDATVEKVADSERLGAVKILMAWMPFVLLTVSVVVWGLPPVLKLLDTVSF